MMNREEFYMSDWDMMMKIWPNCPVKGCKHKINLNLNSGKWEIYIGGPIT